MLYYIPTHNTILIIPLVWIALYNNLMVIIQSNYTNYSQADSLFFHDDSRTEKIVYLFTNIYL